jgi:hypothetical protein
VPRREKVGGLVFRLVAEVDVRPVREQEAVDEPSSSGAEGPRPRVRPQFVDCGFRLPFAFSESLAVSSLSVGDEVPADDTQNLSGRVAPAGTARVELARRAVAELG